MSASYGWRPVPIPPDPEPLPLRLASAIANRLGCNVSELNGMQVSPSNTSLLGFLAGYAAAAIDPELREAATALHNAAAAHTIELVVEH